MKCTVVAFMLVSIYSLRAECPPKMPEPDYESWTQCYEQYIQDLEKAGRKLEQQQEILHEEKCYFQCLFQKWNIVDRFGRPSRRRATPFFVRRLEEDIPESNVRKASTFCFKTLGKDEAVMNDKCEYAFLIFGCMRERVTEECRATL